MSPLTSQHHRPKHPLLEEDAQALVSDAEAKSRGI